MRDTRFAIDRRIRRIKALYWTRFDARFFIYRDASCFPWAATASDGQCVRHVFDIPERRFGITMKRDG